MPIKPIHDVENIPPEAIELLEAAGYMDANTVLDHKISDITTELVKANNVLEIIDTDPDRAMVEQWLKPLEVEFGKAIDEEELDIDSSMLIRPKDILNTPFAVPLSEKFIQDHRIDIDKIPGGTIRFLDKEKAIAHYSNEEMPPVSYNIVSENPPNKDSKKKTSHKKINLFEDLVITREGNNVLDKSRILKMETFKNEGSKIDPIKRDEEVNLTKTTRKETNEGTDPDSRFYIKGVLHKSVSRFKFGCRSFILVNILFLMSFAITALALVDREKYGWVAWAPLLGILAIIIYFSGAQTSSCPICNQKQFAPKKCLKHKNAHHWPLFGYMLPTAIHALLFKWFRCIFCGTSVRLKE